MGTLAAFLILLAADGAVAQASPPPDPPADPLICRRIPETGSLLRSKRVCMTKSQWADQRRSDREAIERAQVQRSMVGE